MNKGLIEHFEILTDPRVERTKRYPLIEIILLIIAGTVSGCDGWKSLKDFGEAKLDWLVSRMAELLRPNPPQNRTCGFPAYGSR